MARYASGKFALGISDRSGRSYKVKNMIQEWDGLFVGKDEYEPKQPQIQPRKVKPDPEALRISRTDRKEPPSQVILNPNSFTSGDAGSNIITVLEPGHNKVTGDIVRFRICDAFDGFTKSMLETNTGFAVTVIAPTGTLVTSNSYTFVATGGETATIGSISGGGVKATAGPVDDPHLTSYPIG